MTRTARDIVDHALADQDQTPRDVINSLPVKYEPRCNICNTQFRPLIDRMIAGPYSYMAIAKQFIDKDEHLSGGGRGKLDKRLDNLRKNIERHAKNHVTIRQAAIREIVEQRALEAGILQEDALSSMATMGAFLDSALIKGLEQITDPESHIKYQDVIEAAKLKKEIEENSYAEQMEVVQRQMLAITKAIKEIVPESYYEQIAARAEEIFYQTTTVIDTVRKELEPAKD